MKIRDRIKSVFMHGLACIVGAFAAFVPSAANAALTVTKVSQVTRPPSATYGAEQIGGITYAGGVMRTNWTSSKPINET